MSLLSKVKPVLVVGDVMLDRYWFGDSTRISPEAPVPVVHVQRTRENPGGAANVAMNLVNLSVPTTLMSVVGDDADGRTLQSLLEASQVRCQFLKDKNVPTTVKLRLIARHQQVVRADFEQKVEHELLHPLVDYFHKELATHQCVVFCDYAKGSLAHLRTMMADAKQAGINILIDPKGSDYSAYHGATLLTPNREEFRQVVGTWRDESDFEQRAFALCEQLALKALLVTRSEEGMSLFIDKQHIRILTEAKEVFDVTGAGDTVIATLAAALSAGHDIEYAARLANVAAGVVVAKVGTTPIMLQELIEHV